ncbi:hypothetical protein C8R43DRAFT_336449 [Mycena crocata]|nr:hypothetical protein C8R43DRAFT_336449 [Mycena crocata]
MVGDGGPRDGTVAGVVVAYLRAHHSDSWHGIRRLQGRVYKGELTEKEKAPWANRGELPADLRFFDNVYTVQCNPKLSPLEDTSVPPNATQALLDQTKSVLDWNQNLLDSTQELLTSSHSLLDRSEYLLDATQSLLDGESDPTSDVSMGSDVQGDAVVVNKGSESTDAMVVSLKAPSVDSATNGDESTTDSKVPVSSTDVTDAGVERFLSNSPVPSGCRSTQTPPSSVEAALKGLRGLIQVTEGEDGIISELDSSSSFRA